MSLWHHNVGRLNQGKLEAKAVTVTQENVVSWICYNLSHYISDFFFTTRRNFFFFCVFTVCKVLEIHVLIVCVNYVWCDLRVNVGLEIMAFWNNLFCAIPYLWQYMPQHNCWTSWLWLGLLSIDGLVMGLWKFISLPLVGLTSLCWFPKAFFWSNCWLLCPSILTNSSTLNSTAAAWLCDREENYNDQ